MNFISRLLVQVTLLSALTQMSSPLPEKENRQAAKSGAFITFGIVPPDYKWIPPQAVRPPDPTNMIFAIGDDEHAPVAVDHVAPAHLTSGPACSSPPSRSQLRPFGLSEQMTIPQVTALGLDFSSRSRDVERKVQSAVLVWRTGKVAECLASDGHTTVTYGFEFDLAVLLPVGTSKRFQSWMQDRDLRDRILGLRYRVAGFGDASPLLEALAALQKSASAGVGTRGLRKKLYAVDILSRTQIPADPLIAIGYQP